MTLYYNGTDITDAVEISEATHHDVSGGRCDCLELTFANPTNWYAWGPKADDIIRFEHNGYSTGDMYVSAFFPEDATFKLTALSMPQKARVKRWQTFRNTKLRDIVYACAHECGMDYGIYGLDENIRYPFLLRRNEGAAAFLNRICAYEGAVLKCVSGKLAVIGINYAQGREPIRSWSFNATMKNVNYQKRSDAYVQQMIVRSPIGDAKIADPTVTNGVVRVSDAPAACAGDAGRWARGLLLGTNRKAESIMVDGMQFDPGVSAMQRVDIDSDTAMNGEWVIDEATHDFINNTTSVSLYRSVKA